MTVSYNTKVSDTEARAFIRLFFRWRGSVWKAVYKELILWLVVYYILNLSYRFVMDEATRRLFERICIFFFKYSDFIPLTFMLGFYVSLVVQRWWSMWENIGWIDTVSLYITTYIHGNDEKSRMYRRSIIRYLLFFQVVINFKKRILKVLVFRDISSSIRDRFPTMETLVPSGYLTEAELDDYLNTPTTYKNYYTPIRWCMNLVRQARHDNRVSTDHAMQDLLNRIMDFRIQLGTLLSYDFQPIPLLYTVVVCLTVRLYFIIALLGRQILISAPSPEFIDLYIPIMTIFQFIFYMGWMKVAEALLNPFGADDDDFECNWLIDRNFEVGYIIADQNNDKTLVRDKNWNTKNPEPFYSIDTLNAPRNPLVGSAVRRNSAVPQKRGSIAGSNNGEVVMVPRAPTNINDEGDLEAQSRLRQRRLSVDVGNGSIINGFRNKLGRLNGGSSAVVYPQTDDLAKIGKSIFLIVLWFQKTDSVDILQQSKKKMPQSRRNSIDKSFSDPTLIASPLTPEIRLSPAPTVPDRVEWSVSAPIPEEVEPPELNENSTHSDPKNTSNN